MTGFKKYTDAISNRRLVPRRHRKQISISNDIKIDMSLNVDETRCPAHGRVDDKNGRYSIKCNRRKLSNSGIYINM